MTQVGVFTQKKAVQCFCKWTSHYYLSGSKSFLILREILNTSHRDSYNESADEQKIIAVTKLHLQCIKCIFSFRYTKLKSWTFSSDPDCSINLTVTQLHCFSIKLFFSFQGKVMLFPGKLFRIWRFHFTGHCHHSL